VKLDKLHRVTIGLNRRFPEGNEPFQMMTRLLEECGELAKEVNHFEGTGIKQEKYGEPDKNHLAKEVMDVLRSALQVAIYYEVESELQNHIENSYQRLKQEGHLHQEE
jgi:NTP pyrophosphatase (non-canonical NTP hydrolase)